MKAVSNLSELCCCDFPYICLTGLKKILGSSDIIEISFKNMKWDIQNCLNFSCKSSNTLFPLFKIPNTCYYFTAPRFEVLRMVKSVSWDVMPCSLLNGYQCYKRTCRLHLHEKSSTLETEAANSLKTLLPVYQIAQCHIPEDSNPQLNYGTVSGTQYIVNTFLFQRTAIFLAALAYWGAYVFIQKHILNWYTVKL